MGYWDTVVSSVKPEITDWLKARGGSVSDLPLNLINRARQRIWAYRPWDFLVTTSNLSLGALLYATLPADLGRILSVYHDSNADGLPDWFYHRNDSRVEHRYTIEVTQTLTSQPSWVITFPTAPSYTPTLEYQKEIENVTADGHYILFPRDLVIRCAQLIFLQGKESNPAAVRAVKDDFDALMIDFEQVCQHSNNAMDIVHRDSFGNELYNPAYGLSGETPHFNTEDRSRDCG